MHFAAMTAQLRPREYRASPTFADGVYAHAAILNAITAQDARLGGALHDMKRHRQMALGLLTSKRPTVLRLAFMAPDGLSYAGALANALATQPTLRLGRFDYEVESIDLTNSSWAGISTWADLLSEKSGRYIRFSFATPTAIMKRGDKQGRFTALFPEPIDVFSGLARRWQDLRGPALPADLEQFLVAGGCVVSNYELRTVRFKTRERTQIGFMGWVVYECRTNNPTCISALNGLARLAFFSGVGYQTARGMGAVRTTISD